MIWCVKFTCAFSTLPQYTSHWSKRGRYERKSHGDALRAWFCQVMYGSFAFKREKKKFSMFSCGTLNYPSLSFKHDTWFWSIGSLPRYVYVFEFVRLCLYVIVRNYILFIPRCTYTIDWNSALHFFPEPMNSTEKMMLLTLHVNMIYTALKYIAIIEQKKRR